MAKRKDQGDGSRGRIRVAAVQMKFTKTIGDNIETIGRLMANAARRRADAVLFPECAVTGYGYDFGGLPPKELRDALVAASALSRELSRIPSTTCLPTLWVRRAAGCGRQAILKSLPRTNEC